MAFIQSTIVLKVLLLIRPFWPLITLAVTIGTLSGLATAWLLATINMALNEVEALSSSFLFRFASLCVMSIGGCTVANAINSFVGQRIIAALRKDISACILRAPIATIEERRPHRLLAILTDDIGRISTFTLNLSGYVIAFAVTVGSFIYLIYLSIGVFVLSAAAVGFGVTIHFYSKRNWICDYEKVRNAQDDLQKQYRAITDGAKELRINRVRRAYVHGVLLSRAADHIASLTTRAMLRFWTTDAFTAVTFFSVVGILVVIQHPFEIGPSVISGTILVLLYVKGPIGQLISALPLFGQAEISCRRIAALMQELSEADLTLDDHREYETDPLRSIELRDVFYLFPSEDLDSQGFALGPINLVIQGGETLFIVGENGSGKTTLIKLLLGLYYPTSGALFFNGELVRDTELDAYRQHFSAVFADYFLFDNLLRNDDTLSSSAVDYLERLKIAHKVAINNNRFSTIDLSTGQRKRLALIHAYLEQRPIVMLDEWAADQDPTFRRIFYTEVLPELKTRGKTLIVISHDDRYFYAADRIIRLEHGRITEDKRFHR